MFSYSLFAAYGGFRASLFTDTIQGWIILILMVIATIAVATNVRIDKHAIDDSGLLKSTSLGWQLLYILAVAITFADFFHQVFYNIIEILSVARIPTAKYIFLEMFSTVN